MPARGRRRWPQHLAAILATLAPMSVGLVGGWTSNAAPQLRLLGLSEEQISWVGSLGPLGALAGALPAGCLADLVGRKMALLLMAMPLMLGWGLVLIANDMTWLLYVGRFVCGISVGGATVVAPIYNEEIADVDIRGEVGVYQNLMIDAGILLAYIIGAYCSYFWQTLVPSFVPVVFCLLFVWMPESPVYLEMNCYSEKARKAVEWLRGEHKFSHNEETNRRLKTSSLTRAKTLVIILGLMTLRQLVGINALVYYTVDIFREAGSTVEESLATIIVGVVQLVATLVASFIVDRVGRKVLLTLSGIGCSLSHLALAVYFWTGARKEVGWLPLVAIAAFIIMYSLGIGSLTWFIIAEIPNDKDKGWMSGLGVSVNWVMLFVVTKVFVDTVEAVGKAYTFLGFGVCCLLTVAFVLALVPETKGRSRGEIQRKLQRVPKEDKAIPLVTIRESLPR